jgi:hypothetical protein
VLAWLPQPDGAPSARNLLGHLERLQALRQVGLPVEIGRTVHQNHLLRLAREGAQTTVYHLKDFEVERHQATLVAILLDTQSTLIDEILDLHDRMVGSAFAKAKRDLVSGTTCFRKQKLLETRHRNIGFLRPREFSALVASRNANKSSLFFLSGSSRSWAG